MALQSCRSVPARPRPASSQPSHVAIPAFSATLHNREPSGTVATPAAKRKAHRARHTHPACIKTPRKVCPWSPMPEAHFAAPRRQAGTSRHPQPAMVSSCTCSCWSIHSNKHTAILGKIQRQEHACGHWEPHTVPQHSSPSMRERSADERVTNR